MENTIANKSIFFAQHWNQHVLYSNKHGFELVEYYFNPGQANVDGMEGLSYHLVLKPLSEISDEEITEVLRLAHNFKSVSNCKIKRLHDIIHCSYTMPDTSSEYHICLNFKYGTINCNLFFCKTDHDIASSHKVNIGEIHFSSSRVVGYIEIVDYLRSKGYALPFRGLSVEKMVTYGWIRLWQNIKKIGT
ncbi:hypothetical protein [Chryseobacterium sp. 2R14A]|uniref:hypothetical protein n=1 Tax=Chryseobacterium sp. 2R14A TaxID=3380353 RepID=UPI003CEA88F4